MASKEIVKEIKDCLEKEMGLDLTGTSCDSPFYYEDRPYTDDGGKVHFRIPCCYLSSKNTYGYYDEERPDLSKGFYIDNAHLKDLIEKYPEEFWLDECCDCCGCGDW